MQGTKLNRTTAYHPQSDGQTENLNKTLEQYLRCVAGETPNLWVQYLPWAEWWYNTSHHSSIGMSPFEALYGYQPPSITAYLPGSTSVAQVDQQLKDRDELLTILRKNLVCAKNRQKQYYDQKHSERSFVIGDMVFLKLQPYRQHSIHQKAFHKLSAKYYGPFEVLERVGSVAYKLKLPDYAKIHNVFHVSLLKKKVGLTASVNPHLPNIADSDKSSWEPAKVLATRLVKRRGQAAAQWLVQWKGAGQDEATWEFSDEMERRFPEFDSDA